MTNQINQITYTPADIIITVIPLVAVTLGIVFLFFLFLWWFKLKKKIIETGQYKDFHTPISYRIVGLLLGIILTFISIPIIILSLVLSGISYFLLLGLIPFFLGLSLIFFYFLYFFILKKT